MKISVLILLPLLCAGASAAEIDALIESARSAPAEFAADAMIRIAATEQVARARKIELLEQAFDKASGAGQAYPRHAVAVRLDGSASYWQRVYRQDLDALTLRLRAVEAMLPLDGKKAKELLVRIPPPDFPRLTCAEFMVYDAGRFSEVLGNVARQDAEPFQLLEKYAGAVTSPVQLGPMARVLAGVPKVGDIDFQKLVAAFATAMGKVSGDDRSFTFSTALGKDILALSEECKRRKASPLPLLEAYRVYLVMNFSTQRCADDDVVVGGQQSFGIYTGQPADPGAANFITFFNEKLRMDPLSPIGELEATPSRLEGVVAPQHLCEDADCKDFVEHFRGLVFGPTGSPLPPAERNTAEWQAKLKARLGALSEWKESSGVGPSEYFREKSGAYSELLNLAQNGPNRELVLQAWLEFLKKNPFQRTNRAEWFLPVNGLIGRVSLDPAGLSKFAEDLKKADDPLIQLYANLESAAPRTADRVLPLL